MEPNSIEKQIKDKLNSREIQPSVQAWDRLDAMLSVAENKKRKPNYFWLYIAASIIGFVFVGLFFFNQEATNPDVNKNSVVEINNSNKQSSPAGYVQTGEAIKKQSVQETSLLETSKSIKKQSNSSKTNKEVLVISETKKENGKLQKNLKTTQEFVKIQEVKENQTLTQNQIQKIDESLKYPSIQNSIVSIVNSDKIEKTIAKKSKLKIDPRALLTEVDGEIEQNFRQKTIKEVVKNFPIVMEAVLTRNQKE
jgi:hypothetical protein